MHVVLVGGDLYSHQ